MSSTSYSFADHFGVHASLSFRDPTVMRDQLAMLKETIVTMEVHAGNILLCFTSTVMK